MGFFCMDSIKNKCGKSLKLRRSRITASLTHWVQR